MTILTCILGSVRMWFAPYIFSGCRFWPEHVRQRINKTYTYFASGLGITSIAAYTATQATSVMRFLATRPYAVSDTCDCYYSVCGFTFTLYPKVSVFCVSTCVRYFCRLATIPANVSYMYYSSIEHFESESPVPFVSKCLQMPYSCATQIHVYLSA